MRHDNKLEVRQKVKEFLSTKPVFLDTETTGFDPDDEVVDIGIVNFDGKEILNSLVKPQKRIPSDASAVHGITNAMVASAPSWAELWPSISEIIGKTSVGIYNEEFDLRLMQQSTEKHQLAWPNSINAFDVMKLFAEYYGSWDDYHQSYTWQKLEFAGRYFKIELPNAHRAGADAQLTREVMVQMSMVT